MLPARRQADRHFRADGRLAVEHAGKRDAGDTQAPGEFRYRDAGAGEDAVAQYFTGMGRIVHPGRFMLAARVAASAAGMTTPPRGRKPRETGTRHPCENAGAMLIVQKRVPRQSTFDAELVLPFELRQKSRLRTTVASGEEIGLFLERGTVLRDGERLQADDGRVVRVVAADEDLLEVRCANSDALARAAYHLGNRHTPAQIGTGWLRIAADDVLAGMLRGLGATVTALRAPFEPETGAYAAGHHAHSGEAKHAGIIHDFITRDRHGA